jgi:hypothetical protein
MSKSTMPAHRSILPYANLSNLPQFLNLAGFFVPLVNDSGRSHFKLKSLMPHSFNEKYQMELAVSRNFIMIDFNLN